MDALVFDTRSGRVLDQIDLSSWSFDAGILATDKATVAVPAYTARAQSIDMRELLTVRKHGIALVEEVTPGTRVVHTAGSIEELNATQDDDGRDSWELTCYGPERVLSLGARVRMFPGWPLVSSTTLLPTGAYDVSLSGLQYGTIMKRLVVEAMKFPGGQLPIDFEPDRAGTRVRNYSAIDGKNLMEALDDIADLETGVEYDFQPYITDDEHIRFRLVTGTDSQRIVQGSVGSHVWSLGGEHQQIKNWARRVNAGAVVTDAIFAGGKEDDAVLFARASSDALTGAGWPRAELWDTSHSSVSQLSTLQSWADGSLGGAVETASLSIRVSAARGLRHGDTVLLEALGHWDMPDGETSWRVLSVGCSSDSADWYEVDIVR